MYYVIKNGIVIVSDKPINENPLELAKQQMYNDFKKDVKIDVVIDNSVRQAVNDVFLKLFNEKV